MTWHDEREPPVYAPGERAREIEAMEWSRPINVANLNACFATAFEWLGGAPFPMAERLFAGHLEILSRPWPSDNGEPYCPSCGWIASEPHESDCPWLSSARACGIA